ncbi:MAG: Serine threonine-protein phosphatase, partial [Paramarteilia canceri]
HSLSKFYESEMENMSKKCQKRNLNLLDKNELQAILRNKVKRDGAVKVKIPEGRKVIAIGDTHGHYGFIQLLEIACKYLKLSNPFNPNTNEGTPAENMPIVFILGDMVDRGIYTVPNYCLAVYAEIRFPEHVFLLKGNHEDGREINSRYGKGCNYNLH